jgi:hypothetical protein
MRKQFDKNGDGELDETERQAMREAFGGQFGGGRSRRQPSGENGVAEQTEGERTSRRSREPRSESTSEEGSRPRRQSVE